MTRRIPGIPTTYAGVNFRSRLEARWAAMFDLLGWKWEYEPFDLNGWIPDFILDDGGPLVEVKPTSVSEGDVFQKAHDAMADTHADQTSVLLVGYTISGSVLGWFEDCCEAYAVRESDKWLLLANWELFTEERYAPLLGQVDATTTLLEMWRAAGNTVQWRPSK